MAEPSRGRQMPRPSACAWIGAPTAVRSGRGRGGGRGPRSAGTARLRAPTRARGASAASPPARRPARIAGPAATPGGCFLAVWVIAPAQGVRRGQSRAAHVSRRDQGGELRPLPQAWNHPGTARGLDVSDTWRVFAPRRALEEAGASSGVRGEEARAAQGGEEGQGRRAGSGRWCCGEDEGPQATFVGANSPAAFRGVRRLSPLRRSPDVGGEELSGEEKETVPSCGRRSPGRRRGLGGGGGFVGEERGRGVEERGTVPFHLRKKSARWISTERLVVEPRRPTPLRWRMEVQAVLREVGFSVGARPAEERAGPDPFEYFEYCGCCEYTIYSL